MKCNFVSLLLVSGRGLQAFREEVAPLRQDVRVVNELSAELTPLDIQLSSTASRQLDQLNMRWKLLQVLSGAVQMFHTVSVPPPASLSLCDNIQSSPHGETPRHLSLSARSGPLLSSNTLFYFLNTEFL